MKKKITAEQTKPEQTHRVMFQGLSGRRYLDMKVMVANGVEPATVAAHFEVPTDYVITETKG